eukprot:gene5607-6029_t
MEIKSTVKIFDGYLIRFSHQSLETKTPMTCALYLPLRAYQDRNDGSGEKVPILYYLSGLTCTDENVCQKSGVFKSLSNLQIAFVAPDTSPRGANIPGEDDSWDFGTGAGFYLDASKEPWSNNYRMYSYITKELPSFLASNFPILDTDRASITGHSMGGHGALTIALKNQNLYKSVSAFSPICHPSNCPWGIKAFTNYLGEDSTDLWNEYDATSLLRSLGKTKFESILIDVGTDDSFLKAKQLLPEDLQEAATDVGQNICIRYQEGFDHSYYFISTFIEDHIIFHAKHLGKL